MCVTDCHDMTLIVKVALNPNTTNQDEHDFCSEVKRYTASFTCIPFVTNFEANIFFKKHLYKTAHTTNFNPLPQNPDFYNPKEEGF